MTGLLRWRGPRFAGGSALLILARVLNASGGAVRLAAAVLLVGLLAGAIAVGSGLVKLPAILPPSAPSPVVIDSPSASPQQQDGVVAYELGGGIWIVNPDGTGMRELVPELVPGDPGGTNALGWLPDGSRLVYWTADGLEERIGLTDALGSERVTYGSLCPVAVDAADVLDSCHAELEGVGISPDGTRVAYAVWGPARGPSDPPPDVELSAIAILDLATGRVTKVASTETSNPLLRVCDTAANQGMNHSPTWSPDGRSLLFTRDFIGPLVDGECQNGAFTVNADGSDLRELALPDAMRGQPPVWSPDGSTFFFNAGGDVHTGHAGFTDIRAATSDGLSGARSWTRDGRIIFTRWTAPGPGAGGRGDIWVMDSDGGNATPLEATVPALSAAGCMVCPYPVYAAAGEAVVDPLVMQTTPPFEAFWITLMYWQPTP